MSASAARADSGCCSTCRGCCRAASARCCWPTSAPTCSRSRTPAWATTCAGRRPTTRAPTTRPSRLSSSSLNRGKRSIRLNLKEEAGARCCCGWCASTTCCSSRFGPGVMERLGVGYERLREENPRLVYCAITGYGQDGPLHGPLGPRHELPRPQRAARPDRRRRRAAGAVGGPDRRPRRRGADGRVRHPGGAARARAARARGSSWTCRCSTARWRGWRWWRRATSADGEVPGRGDLELAGRLICYRPYACKDGWVTLGALEPKFWQAWCRGVGREDLIEKQFERPGSEAHAEVERIFRERTRDEWHEFAERARLLPRAGARSRRGARLGARARARDGRGGRPAGHRRRAPAGRAGEALAHAGRARRTRPGAGRAHARGAGRARLLRRARSTRSRRPARRRVRRRARRELHA